MRSELILAAILAAGVLVPQVGSADASGAMVGRTCNGCHGTDGVSKGAAPSLKGIPAAYIEKAMLDFKSGKRPATVMGRIAKGYSDQEIAAVGQYFGSMK